MKKYRVDFNYWKANSGFYCTETFCHLDEETTAKEFIENFDGEIFNDILGYDDILVKIFEELCDEDGDYIEEKELTAEWVTEIKKD